MCPSLSKAREASRGCSTSTTHRSIACRRSTAVFVYKKLLSPPLEFTAHVSQILGDAKPIVPDFIDGRCIAGALTVGSPSPLLSAPGWRPRHAEARVEGTTGEMRQWWRACGDEADGRPQSRGRLDLCSPQPSRPSAPCRGMFGWASIQAAWQACSAACCVIDMATAFAATLVAECTSMAMASSGGPVVRGAAESMGANAAECGQPNTSSPPSAVKARPPLTSSPSRLPPPPEKKQLEHVALEGDHNGVNFSLSL